MIRRILTLVAVFCIMLACAGTAGCNYDFVGEAARANLVSFATDVFGIAVEGTVFPNGG